MLLLLYRKPGEDYTYMEFPEFILENTFLYYYYPLLDSLVYELKYFDPVSNNFLTTRLNLDRNENQIENFFKRKSKRSSLGFFYVPNTIKAYDLSFIFTYEERGYPDSRKGALAIKTILSGSKRLKYSPSSRTLYEYKKRKNCGFVPLEKISSDIGYKLVTSKKTMHTLIEIYSDKGILKIQDNFKTQDPLFDHEDSLFGGKHKFYDMKIADFSLSGLEKLLSDGYDIIGYDDAYHAITCYGSGRYMLFTLKKNDKEINFVPAIFLPSNSLLINTRERALDLDYISRELERDGYNSASLFLKLRYGE